MHYTLDLEAVAECRQVLDLAFAHAFPPCTNTFDCLPVRRDLRLTGDRVDRSAQDGGEGGLRGRG